MSHPKVFISYSHDTKEHKDWVLGLATDLRTHGVDIILDQWDLRIGDDLPFFMESGLSSSKLVICVCSESYVQKSNESIGGAGYEKNIIVQPLLKKSNLNHIIPVIKNNGSDNLTPTFLGTKNYIDFRSEDDYYDAYTELISRIYNEDLSNKPPLGENPFQRNQASKILDKVSIESVKYHNSNNEGTVSFNYENNSGLFTIGSGTKEFTTSWSPAGRDSIYAYNDKVKLIGDSQTKYDFPAINDIEDLFDFSSRTRHVKPNDIIIWINNYNHIAATKIISISNKDRGDDESKINFEFKIYHDVLEDI